MPKQLIGVRRFRDQLLNLREPVIVLRRTEILGIWTPAKERFQSPNGTAETPTTSNEAEKSS